MKSILVVLAITFSVSCFGQYPTPVKDKSKINQMKSMEYMQWKFTPRWYYSLFHRSYRRTNKNNINQYTPALGFTEITKGQADQQQEETNIVYKQELAKFVDREIDYQYLLKKKTFDDLLSDISEELSVYSDGGGAQENVTTIQFEADRIKTNIELTKNSFMSNSKKREAYLGFEKELAAVRSMTYSLNRFKKLPK